MNDPASYDGSLAILVAANGPAGRGRGILFRLARDTSDRDVVAMAAQGGVCTVTINEGAAMRLGLFPQGHAPAPGEAPYFVNSVEAIACSETGISARERALTMRTLGARETEAGDIQSPGHIMVQVARNILRPGATLPEQANLLLAATTDTRFAGWCDILDETGDVASADHCLALAARLNLRCYYSDAVRRLGRERLAPWVEAVRFSRDRFGD